MKTTKGKEQLICLVHGRGIERGGGECGFHLLVTAAPKAVVPTMNHIAITFSFGVTNKIIAIESTCKNVQTTPVAFTFNDIHSPVEIEFGCSLPSAEIVPQIFFLKETLCLKRYALVESLISDAWTLAV